MTVAVEELLDEQQLKRWKHHMATGHTFLLLEPLELGPFGPYSSPQGFLTGNPGNTREPTYKCARTAAVRSLKEKALWLYTRNIVVCSPEYTRLYAANSWELDPIDQGDFNECI